MGLPWKRKEKRLEQLGVGWLKGWDIRTQSREQLAVSMEPKENDGLVKGTDRKKKDHQLYEIKLGLDTLLWRERDKKAANSQWAKAKA